MKDADLSAVPARTDKTKAKIIDELAELSQQISKLEKAKAEFNWAKKTLGRISKREFAFFRWSAISQYLGLILLAVCMLAVCTPLLSAQDNQVKRVLVLHSYHRDLSWDDSIDRGVESVFKKEDLRINIQTEYMDTKRIYDSVYIQKLHEIYQHKFKNRRFDVIISSDNNALDFLLKHRDELFPRTPVVFCGINNFRDSMLEGYSLYTGTAEAVDIRETLDIALKLHPKAKHFVVYGDNSPTYLANKEILERIIPDYESSVDFIFKDNFNIREIREHIRKLPSNSLILLISTIRDEQGQLISFERSAEMMAAVSSVPIYGCWDFFLGHGIVGGKLISGFAQGETAAKIALCILNDEKVENIPVVKESPNRYMFDYKQMQRSSIEVSDLPEGSIVINRPYSFYSEHKFLIWSVVASIACLTFIILFLATNIIIRKRTEEALQQSEERYRGLVEKSFDGIFIQKGPKIIFTNQRLNEMLGYDEGELLGLDHWLIYHPDYQDITRERAQARMQGEMVTPQYEVKLQRKDGSWLYGEISARVISFKEELGIQVWVKNITERKHAEEDLKESEERYRTLFQGSRDAVYITTRDGKFVDANQSTLDLFGYTREEIRGLKAHQLYADPIDSRKFQKEVEQKGFVRDYEVKLHKKDGTEMDCLFTVSVRRADDGSILGYYGIIRDITEKKKLEAQLQYSQKMEAIGTLAGGIAHNFNNLLMGMQGNVSLMLLDTDSDHPNYERLKNIEKMVQSGSKLTSQLLGYARGGRYEVKPISFNQLVKDTSNTFGMTKKDITFHQDLDKDLFGIITDQGQIEQVLLNLYVNAADAMPQGGDLFLKTINVTHADMIDKPYEPKPGNYILLTVRDTGVGMDKETMERIFDPFFTTKGLAKGTGLGLASVYGIIKAHGGYIDVYSEKGHGATFNIYLPATSAKRKELRAEGMEKDEMTRGKETVLLVDDEEMVLDVGVQLLKTLGYTVLEAKGGIEAVEIYKKNNDTIDIVILDMIMPVIGGGETYDRMKEIDPNIKVLLSSGYSINGQATEILKRGCDGFIQKPFTMKELSKAIKDVLDNE